MGAIAAMALPPQMAVPKEISWVMILSILKIYPRTIPKTTISVMLKTVNKKPSEPACNACLRLIPKPNPTIETCKTILIILSALKTCPKILTKIIPRNKAIGGETTGKKHNAAKMMNRIFKKFLF